MKNLFILALFMTCAVSVSFAQSGSLTGGLQLSHASAFDNMGIGVKVQYSITDHWRVEPSFDITFKHHHNTMWDINANVHYVLNVVDKFNIYPLAGLTFSHWTGDINCFGVNLGMGAEYYINSRWGIFAELKYQLIPDYNQTLTSIGVNYRF